ASRSLDHSATEPARGLVQLHVKHPFASRGPRPFYGRGQRPALTLRPFLGVSGGIAQMPLRSRLFRGNPALEACLVQDSAHVTPGTVGEHVQLIQRALVYLGDKTITGTEYRNGTYGQTTAAAVLQFKKQRGIINRSYQTQADNIVGKMTIRRLDDEMVRIQDRPPSPLLGVI